MMKSTHNSHTAVASSSIKLARKEAREFRRWYKQNDEFVRDVLLSLLADFHGKIPFVYGCTDYAKDCETLKKRLVSEGVSFAAKTLPALSTGLLDWLEGRKPQYSSWKLQRGREYPAFLRRLFAVAYDVKHKYHVDCVKYIYQFGVAFKKIRGPYRHSALEKQKLEFVETDKNLPDTLPEENSVEGQILVYARACIEKVIANLDPHTDKHFKPNPGPGATNHPVAKHLRYKPHVMYEQLDSVMPYERWFFPLPSLMYSSDRDYGGINEFMQMWCRQKKRPTSRFKQVPKTFEKAREICIEEHETQFFQQAIKNGLVKRIEGCKETKGFVNFTLQEINQILAISASKDRAHATLDMKGASNRVLRILVDYFFSTNPELNACIQALACETVVEKIGDEDKVLIDRLKMYAPMGSALCFPVMSLVHYGLIRGIQIYYAELFRDKKYLEPVYVYGDDLIVPQHIVGLLFKHFPTFGMKFNEDKSYYNGYFRESCGVHAYKGVNITPVYIKYTPNNKHVESILSGLAVEMQLHDLALYKTAAFVKACIEHHTGSLPYVSKGSSILGFRRDLTAHEQKEQFYSHALKFKQDRWFAKPPFTDYYDNQQMLGRFKCIVPYLEDEPSYAEIGGYMRRLTCDAYQHTHVKGSLIGHKYAYKWLPQSRL